MPLFTNTPLSGLTTASPSSNTPPVIMGHALPLRRAALTLILCASALFGSSAIAWDGAVPGWEEAVLRFFNDWPDFLEPAMWVLQQVGVFGTPVVVGLGVLWFTRRWIHLVAFSMVLPLKLMLEKGVVKKLVERERPFVSVGPDIHVRGPAFEGLSFPSGHATTAFATAILLSAFLPRRLRFIPLSWAVIVGVARLYYGEHNLLDVVAGAAMGIAFATVIWLVILNRSAHPECDCVP